MVEVLTNAVALLSQHEWWATIHSNLEAWNDTEQSSYAAEAAILDSSLFDGLSSS